MYDAVLQQIGLGFAGGLISCLLFYGILSFKLFRLSFAVAGLQAALVSLRNSGKAKERWDRRAELEQDLKQSGLFKNEREGRFANDPLSYG